MGSFDPDVAVLVSGDGRDDLKKQTLQSFGDHARDFNLACVIEIDDRDHKLGFCGAWREGMRRVIEHEADFRYVFPVEEDWRFDRAFSIADMATILDRPWATMAEREMTGVGQVALQRNAITSDEIASGGVIRRFNHECKLREAWSPSRADGRHKIYWFEHKLWLTTNPHLIRRSSAIVAAAHIPEPPQCEGALGSKLVNSGWHYAYLGSPSDEPWITHLGERTGTGY